MKTIKRNNGREIPQIGVGTWIVVMNEDIVQSTELIEEALSAEDLVRHLEELRISREKAQNRSIWVVAHWGVLRSMDSSHSCYPALITVSSERWQKRGVWQR